LENQQNIYELKFEQGIASSLSIADAAIMVIEFYLDGNPNKRGKVTIKNAERNTVFWTSQFLNTLSTDVYESEPFVLALTLYMGQEQIANFELIQHIAQISPETVHRAVRYSSLVLRQDSERWKEIEQLAITKAVEFGELIRICHFFNQAHRERLALVETCRKPLSKLLPLELLVYASFYGFEHLIPKRLNLASQSEDDASADEVWLAINDILLWKLRTSSDNDLRLTETIIGNSLRTHLSPFLFPTKPNQSKGWADIYHAFNYLIDAQIELNSFLSRSIDAFCYDDSINFEFTGTELVIVECDANARKAWQRNGERLVQLHNYWLYRAYCKFETSAKATVQIGSLENHESNRLAYIKAIRTQLRLAEVYGLSDSVLTETKLPVDIFQALLSLELMTVFYNNAFLIPYDDYLSETDNWRKALAGLAMDGLVKGENRFPIAWSERDAKIKNVRAWTVNKEFPHGHLKAAEAILDFWSCDIRELSAQLRNGEPALTPTLSERPILKIGRYLFELPWMMAMQNNSTAAINNLRRIGARRVEVGEETRCIEQRLAEYFEDCGFRVCLNYHPVRTLSDNAGEIDLICMRDGQLLVLEIKSTFLRSSMKDAWLHKTTALRKAGLQLKRKVKAVQTALFSDIDLALALGISENMEMPTIHGWIVDTSIEHDHEFFSGFLKVSLEEVLIALRDDRHWLNDPFGLFTGQPIDMDNIDLPEPIMTPTLYPNGFSGECFVDVIEQQTVWAS
jgi:hypothetical protein